MAAPRFLMGGGLRPGTIELPITIAALTRSDGSVVLVDAGFSCREMDDPRGELGRRAALFSAIIGNGSDDSAVAKLAGLGIKPDAVKAIVATHLHLDHVGAFVDFPNAEIVALRSELDSARDRGALAGFVHIDGILRSGRANPVSLVSGEQHGFPAHLDLFGDGQVLLLDARGHTAGSTAVLLTDPDTSQQALMIGDAAYVSQEYRQRKPTLLARITRFNAEWHRSTWGIIADFEARNFTVPVVPSHCNEALMALQQTHSVLL